MDDIIKQLNDLPYERLEQLEDKIKNIKEGEELFLKYTFYSIGGINNAGPIRAGEV